MAAVLRLYQAHFDAYPLVTLAATNSSLTALGDIVAQTAQMIWTAPSSRVPNRPRWHGLDLERTVRFAAFGALMGPLIGRWNIFLERHFPLRSLREPASGPISWRALGKRVLADQTAIAPTGLAIFIGTMGVMEGRQISGIQKKYADMYRPALIANWEVWPAVQLINFRFMPLAYRVPFQATAGVFWTLYLSLLNAREEAQDRPK
ncbi:hypothetical protein BS47DRAFT_1330791 [Hydnum rufescens UP504]|uniref:Uncharacterized protein n=1 Tax=Hydnum rufescens UP504 TaxID=1448309 RepID=A0A9P6ATH2_9AGAM|nr:hypothetical protein BS47DRAFT_1330791 [Hydnum rufescens UP504]